jgi:hypothetical protein
VVAPPPGESWYTHTRLCWEAPLYPSEGFHMYYLAKVGTHIEDLLCLAVKIGGGRKSGGPKGRGSDAQADGAGGAEPEDGQRDGKMALHHVATAALCLGSWAGGYAKVGSVVMMLHDISDVPLDGVRVSEPLEVSHQGMA